MSGVITKELARLRAGIEAEDLTIGELLGELGHRSYALAVILFCAVFLTPVPLPGLSSVFGVVVVALGIGLMSGRPPWLPARWMHRRIPKNKIGLLLTAAERVIAGVGAWARPRGKWAAGTIFPRLCGLGIAVSAVILALPLPPGGNFSSALGCVLFAVAILARDGLFALYGALAMAASGGILAVVLWSAWRALDYLTGR